MTTAGPSTPDDDGAFDWGPRDDSNYFDPRATGDQDAPEGGDATGQEATTGEPGVWLTAVLGGLYVMWALAWVIGLAQQPVPQFASRLEATMFSFGQFLAYISTPLWFVAAIFLGATWSARTRGGFLLLGLLVLLPWPFILPAVLTA